MNDVLGVSQTVDHALKILREPVERLFGAAWNEIGGALGDRVRHWRDMRRLELALAAVAKLRAKGIDPQTVEPSILFPILDAGSLATDAFLKEKWAKLLATAANPRAEIDMTPSFAEILKQLTPLEARILDWVEKSGDPEAHQQSETFVVVAVSLSALQREFSLSAYDADVIASNLARLGLVDTMASAVNNVAAGEPVPQPSYRRFALTPIAVRFMGACKD